MSTLSDVRWVFPAVGSAFREEMDWSFALIAAGWLLRGISTNSILAIKSLVMNTAGVSIIAGRLVEAEVKAGYRKTPAISDYGAQRMTVIVWQRDDALSPTADSFPAIFRETARADLLRVPAQ